MNDPKLILILFFLRMLQLFSKLDHFFFHSVEFLGKLTHVQGMTGFLEFGSEFADQQVLLVDLDF